MNLQKRINYQGELKLLLNKVITDYRFGSLKGYKILEIGYEDFNLIIKTTTGRYFLKVFTSARTHQEIENYIRVIESALKAGINHPQVLKNQNNQILTEYDIENAHIDLIVMEYLPAKNLMQIKKCLSKSDIDKLIKQSAAINTLNIKSKKIYDSWSIENLVPEYSKIAKQLSYKDKLLLEPVINQFRKFKQLAKLPRCFVHGDLANTNIIRYKDKMYILDFSVAGNFPRIQELAVLFANTIFNYRDSFTETLKKFELTVTLYQKYNLLSKLELRALPLYIAAAFATNIVGIYRVTDGKKLGAEDKYWLKVGREGLKLNIENRLILQ